MSTALLGRHLPSDEVCFGERGSRVRAQLMAYAGNIAQALAGLQPGERVVLACRDRYCFAASLLACLAQGRVVLLPENAQKEALSSLRQRMPVGAVLTDQADVPGLDVRALEDPEARSDADFVCGLGPNDVAFVAFTSGSTGEPQPHEKSLGQLTIEAENHVHELGLARARVVSAVPAHHIYGLLFGMLAPLLGGGSVVRENALFPEAIGDLISRHRASVLVAVPAHLSVLAQLPVQEWPTLTRIFSSAGPLPPSTAATLRARGLCVVEILGSTETGGIAHRSADGSPFLTLSPVEASVDEDGVLYVSSPWLAPWGSRVVRTAERAELVSGGFRHLGRVDSVVKVGGRRVDLQDVEAQLCRTAGVTAARVLAVDGGASRGVALWAVVAGAGLTVEALRRSLARRFEPVTWPRRYRLVSELPRSETGKVRRADLLRLFAQAESAPEPELVLVDTAGLDA